MTLCQFLNAVAIDYGCRPSDLVRGGLADVAFDIAVHERALAK